MHDVSIVLLAPRSPDRPPPPRRAAGVTGFSLIEVVIAAGLVALLASAVAPLIDRASRVGRATARDTIALGLAVQKLEQLRGLTWALESSTPGPVSDRSTDLATDPPGPGGRGLSLSPAGTLRRNVVGYVDHVDANGRWLASGPVAPTGTVYVRRWSVRPAPGRLVDLLVLDVVVMPLLVAAVAPLPPGPAPPGLVRLTTLRGRR